MGGPGRGMMPGEKPKDFKNSIEKLVRYLGRYWYAIVAVMILRRCLPSFPLPDQRLWHVQRMHWWKVSEKDRGNRIY